VAETGEPYAYTGDDPVNATDPLGLKKKPNRNDLPPCSNSHGGPVYLKAGPMNVGTVEMEQNPANGTVRATLRLNQLMKENLIPPISVTDP
jgi:hypothetical protein